MSVVETSENKGKHYAEYQADKAGKSWKSKLKIAVDALIPQVSSFEELLQYLQEAGYEIKRGKYISCRAQGQERFTRLKTLGADHSEEAITERINGKRTRAAKAPKIEQRGVSLIIDIENSIKAQQSRGYEQWAKIHNLKQAAKTVNFLTEHKIEQYADLVARIDEITAAKALRAANVGGKLPSVATLQAEYAKLTEQKEALYADYGRLKKQVKEYDTMKRNIDSFLKIDRGQAEKKNSVR